MNAKVATNFRDTEMMAERLRLDDTVSCLNNLFVEEGCPKMEAFHVFGMVNVAGSCPENRTDTLMSRIDLFTRRTNVRICIKQGTREQDAVTGEPIVSFKKR